MRTTDDGVLGALEGAGRFLDTNKDRLSSAVDFSTARKQLDAVTASFTTHAFTQDASDRSAKAETEKQKKLRLTIRAEQMAPIAVIARQNLSTVPEFKALQMPPSSAKGAAFIASAEGMADAAGKNKDALVERGLPADFLDQFQTALTLFKASVTDRKEVRTHRMGATKGIAVQVKEGRSVLRVLDALVRRAAGGDEALLRTWQAARAIPGGQRSTQTTAPATQASTSTSPAATPAGTRVSSATPTAATAA